MKRIILAVIFMFLFYSFIYAEEEIWEPVSAGPITTWTAPLCEKGKFVAQSFFAYERIRGTFNSEGHYDSLLQGDKKYQFKQQLFMQYGIFDALEIDCQVEYQENYATQGDRNAHSDGWGDSYIFLRHCSIEEAGILPHLTGVLQLKIPTGKYEGLDPDKLGTDSMGADSGGGSYDPGLGLILTKKVRPLVFHADLIYAVPQEARIDGVETRYGRYLNCDLGVEYFLSKGFNLMLEFNGFIQADKEEDGARAPASDIKFFTFAPGIGWSNNKIQTLFSYQRIFTGTNTDAKDAMVFTFVYSF